MRVCPRSQLIILWIVVSFPVMILLLRHDYDLFCLAIIRQKHHVAAKVAPIYSDFATLIVRATEI